MQNSNAQCSNAQCQPALAAVAPDPCRQGAPRWFPALCIWAAALALAAWLPHASCAADLAAYPATYGADVAAPLVVAPLDAQVSVGTLPVRQATPVSPSSAQVPAIKSAYALVVDQDTDEVLLEKNPDGVSPIASITKLMTAMVTLDAGLPLSEELEVLKADRTASGWGGSALRPGLRLTRAQALHLALMSSENHAAQLLGRTYPGGLEAAIAAMNVKARELGMTGAKFIDPTGLSAENRASPVDLVRLVKAAYEYPEIREFSVSTEYALPLGKHLVRYRNTNKLTSHPDWQIGLQKTGYINAAGRCLVMQAVIEGRRVVLVLLDSIGRYSRFADAQRIRDWLVAGGPALRGAGRAE